MKRAVTKNPLTRKNRIDLARRALVAKRAALLRRRQGLADDEAQLNAEQEADWEDVAAVRTTSTMLSHLSGIELVQLERISQALRRIEAGTYGRCAVCGDPISDARLEAVPEAVTCTECTYSN